MNIATRLILLIGILLLTGCRSQVNPATSNNDLFAFDENRQAIIRGNITGDWACSTVDGKLRATLNIDVPVLVDGVESSVMLLFTLTFDTQLASDQTPYTNLRDYLAANPDSSTFDAFPLFQTVEVTFTKGEWDFEALSIRQVDAVIATPEMNNILLTGISSRGTLEGTIHGSNWGDTITWTLAVPVTVQSTPASLLIPIQADEDTQVVANGSNIPMDMYHPIGNVCVEYKRTNNSLKALRFIEMP